MAKGFDSKETKKITAVAFERMELWCLCEYLCMRAVILHSLYIYTIEG